jgi:SAM-dependent methyltransferase
MDQTGGIIGLAPWLKTPPGQYLLAWEQAQLDPRVADIFGFHAVQLGLPALDGLRANRMPHRWVAEGPMDTAQGAQVPHVWVASEGSGSAGEMTPVPVALRCDFDALPFDSQSLDLIVLPHTLEQSRDPHLTLSEVERVLRPEGRAVILGFNTSSLWGLRHRLGRIAQAVGGRGPLFLPQPQGFIGYWRLRDWLRLLSFEVEAGRFGCHGLPFNSPRALARFAWIDAAGERWWPVFGAVYLVVAVKRVRGMRLVGLARTQRQPAKGAAAALTQRHGGTTSTTTSHEH